MSDENYRENRKRRLLVMEDSSNSSSIEGSSRKKRRQRRYNIEESSSESESDSSVEVYPRRRVARVRSDSSFSSRSEESRDARNNTQSSSSSSSLEKECEPSVVESASKVKTTVEDMFSSADEEDSERKNCPICLIKFRNQEVGSPNCCDHSFCARCIEEWSKSANTCPVDRKKFNSIVVRCSYKGKHVRTIPVDELTDNVSDISPEELTCVICNLSEHQDRMLLCDRCDLAYHLDCFNPPLAEVPDGQWFCLECREHYFGTSVITTIAAIASGIRKYFEGNSNSKPSPKVQREMPLYDMELVIVGKFEGKKDEFKKQITLLGGKVVTKIRNSVMALIGTAEDVKKMSARIREAKDADVRVVSEDFLSVAEEYSGRIPELVIQKSICDWGTDPHTRLPPGPSSSNIKSKSSSVLMSSTSSKVTQQLKNGGAVDPDSGLVDTAHIYQSRDEKYTAVLGLTDIKKQKNSYYKLQLLQSDFGNVKRILVV